MKLNFKYIEQALLNYNAKSEYKQASIVMLRNIFEEAETKHCDIPSVRQRFLSLCQKKADWNSYKKPTEETEFNIVCKDGLDFVELIVNCEKEFDIKIDEFGKGEYSFNTVKDFIDWVIPQYKKYLK